MATGDRVDCITLTCRENGSSKQYTIWLQEESGNLWTVHAQWGPIGGTVQSGTKAFAVVRDKAERIYSKVILEKKAKGYVLGEDAPAFSQVEGAVDSGIRPMLLTDATEAGVEPYILSDDWIAQEKMNGKRIMLQVSKSSIGGINRRGLLCPIPNGVGQTSFPYAEGVTVLDGELIGEVYHVFDIVQQAGIDLRNELMDTRFKLLSVWLGEGIDDHVKVVPIHKGSAAKRALVEKLRAGRREGVVFKHIGAHYKAGRVERLSLSSAVKVKFYSEASLLILGWTDKSSIRVAARTEDGGKAHVFVGNVTVPQKYVAQINAAIAAPEASLVRVRYLYATPNRILYQPTVDPDDSGSITRTDAAEADLLSSLKLEGKGDEE